MEVIICIPVLIASGVVLVIGIRQRFRAWRAELAEQHEKDVMRAKKLSLRDQFNRLDMSRTEGGYV